MSSSQWRVSFEHGYQREALMMIASACPKGWYQFGGCDVGAVAREGLEPRGDAGAALRQIAASIEPGNIIEGIDIGAIAAKALEKGCAT